MGTKCTQFRKSRKFLLFRNPRVKCTEHTATYFEQNLYIIHGYKTCISSVGCVTSVLIVLQYVECMCR